MKNSGYPGRLSKCTCQARRPAENGSWRCSRIFPKRACTSWSATPNKVILETIRMRLHETCSTGRWLESLEMPRTTSLHLKSNGSIAQGTLPGKPISYECIRAFDEGVQSDVPTQHRSFGRHTIVLCEGGAAMHCLTRAIVSGHRQTNIEEHKFIPDCGLSLPIQVKRCEKNNVLWNTILTWTAAATTVWLHREIGTFLRNIKSAISNSRKVQARADVPRFGCKVSTIATGFSRGESLVLDPTPLNNALRR